MNVPPPAVLPPAEALAEAEPLLPDGVEADCCPPLLPGWFIAPDAPEAPDGGDPEGMDGVPEDGVPEEELWELDGMDGMPDEELCELDGMPEEELWELDGVEGAPDDDEDDDAEGMLDWDWDCDWLVDSQPASTSASALYPSRYFTTGNFIKTPQTMFVV